MAGTKSTKPVDITTTGKQSWSQLQELNNADYDSGKRMSFEEAQEFFKGTPGIGSALAGIQAYNTQWEGFDEASPIMQSSRGEDYYGKSAFDPDIINDSDWMRWNAGSPNELRAENQPWYSKLLNGVAKGGVTAVTTALEGILGLTYGLGQGIYNAITYDEDNDVNGEGNRGGAFLHGLWNNPVTRALQAINEASEETMPNYLTRDEQENPLALRNIISANFIGNDIIKNAGFMVGAFYGGIPLAKGLGALGTAAVKNARTAFQAELKGMGVAVKDAEKIAAGDTKALDRLLSAKHLTETERGERLKNGLEKINRIANTTRATTQLVGALGSAINEGAIEAINNSKDWAEAQTRLANDKYDSELADRFAEIENDYGGTEDEQAMKIAAREEIEARRQMELAEIEKGRAAVGNADLLMNIPILTYTNMAMFGKLYTRGFNTTRRKMGSIWNGHKLAGSAAEGTLKTTKTWKGGIRKGISNSLHEGAEEYLQRSASDAAGNEVKASIDRYLHSGDSEDSKVGAFDYITGFAKAVADNTGNPDAWKEFMVGALSSAIGMPVFGSQTRNAYMKLGPVGFAGGMVGNYKDYMNEKKNEKIVADYINKRVNEDSFKALYDYLRKSEDYDKALMTALNNGDKEEFKNLEAEKLFEDINAFASSGHLEEFKQLVGYNEEYDAEELKHIVENTRKPITAEQQKQRDEERLSLVTRRLAEYESVPEEEGTESIDEELTSIAKERSVQRQMLRRATDDKSKQNVKDELSRLQERQDQLIKQRQEIVERNNKNAKLREDKENLEEESKELQRKIAGEYQDRDEGAFIQMVNGIPIGMNTIPDTDESGNPIKGTEGNEMRRILDRNREKLLKGINDYLKIRDNIDVETDGRLTDKEISILTKMKMQILDKEARTLEMVDDLVNGLRPITELEKESREKGKKALEDAKTMHTAALKLLNDAKANKDISPDTVAELEKKVVESEAVLKTAEKGVSEMDNAVAGLSMMTDMVKTTRRERRALNRGYGRNEDNTTYEDLHDNTQRNATLDELTNILLNPSNALAFAALINKKGNNLTDAEKARYTGEVFSLHSLAVSKKEYNDQLRKFMKDPTLIKEAMADSNVRMTQKEIDNKSDELALRIKRAKNMVELDGILRNSQIAPEVVELAMKKAKEDGVENFNIEDYEKARRFFRAFNEKLPQYLGELSEDFLNSMYANASTAWNEALSDDSSDSKYDKFIDTLNDFADSLEAGGDKKQADTIRDILGELKTAAETTSTNSSSSVRTPSASSSTTASGNSSSTSAATGTAPISKDKVNKQIDHAIDRAIRQGKAVSGIDDLGAEATTVKRYNAQNSNEFTDEVIKQRYLDRLHAYSDEQLNNDESVDDDGSTVSEENAQSKKSAEMKSNLRITFKGGGVTEFRIYEGEKGAVLAEGKNDYPRSDEAAEVTHQILSTKTADNPIGTGAYDFLKHNFLGYLQQSLNPGESIKVHLLRSNNPKTGNKVFIAIEWDNKVAQAIKRNGFGEDSEVTIPDTSIEAIDKDGNKKKYQVIGDLSILSEDEGMDPGISQAFFEVLDEVNSELSPVLEANKEEQWAVSDLTSEIDEIYTGRLVKKSDPKDTADSKVDLNSLMSDPSVSEWNGDFDFLFGVVTNGDLNIDDDSDIVKPNPAWLGKKGSRGAILVFLPKPDGKLYPIRCTRKTIAEWFADSDGEAKLDQVLSGKLKNEYLEDLVDTIKALLNPDASIESRVKAKMDLKKFFVLGHGGKKISVGFDQDVVKISFDDAAHNKHVIQVNKNELDKGVTEFIKILKNAGIPFSIPLPSQSQISGRDIISSGIFKTGIKDFYNFNPSFTILPINRNGELIQPEVPESERAYFAGSTTQRPNALTLDLGSGPVIYHIDNSTSTPTFYKSKVDGKGNPTGAVSKVTDPFELVMVSTIHDIQNGNHDSYQALSTMLNALMPGENFKERREAFNKALSDSWSKVYIIHTGVDGVWYFDNRSSSHTKTKIFKQGTPEAAALKKEFEEAVKKKEKEVDTQLMSGGLKPKPKSPEPEPAKAGKTAQTFIDRMNRAKTHAENDKAANEAGKAGIPESEWMGAYHQNAKRIADEKEKGKGSSGSQGQYILVGKPLSSFKSDAPEVIKLLKSKKVKDVLDDYVDTIYSDLQNMEQADVSVLDRDVYNKIGELTKMTDPDDVEKAWKAFVSEKMCGK